MVSRGRLGFLERFCRRKGRKRGRGKEGEREGKKRERGRKGEEIKLVVECKLLGEARVMLVREGEKKEERKQDREGEEIYLQFPLPS